jgi:hypothetical protein
LIDVGRELYTSYIHHHHFVIDDIDHFTFFVGMKNQNPVTDLEFHDAPISPKA